MFALNCTELPGAAIDACGAGISLRGIGCLLYTSSEMGDFDVMGHLTYPLRYMFERNHLRLDLKPYEDKFRQLFKNLTETVSYTHLQSSCPLIMGVNIIRCNTYIVLQQLPIPDNRMRKNCNIILYQQFL